MRAAWMFPGQGAQRAGMWEAFGSGERRMREASQLLDDDLIGRCGSAPPASWPCELLQPVLLTVCVVAAEQAWAAGERPAAVVGHSVGEFAAWWRPARCPFPQRLRSCAAAARRWTPPGRWRQVG
jgi:acyl transferase domain-containing protein